jgi:hypothetical protein
MMLAEDLANWDTGHRRMFYETMHAIKYTAYFEPDDAQTRYVATVSGRENVKGSKGGMKAGDEVWLDAKKCSTPVNFTAETSKDTPADRRDREERARTAHKEGIFTKYQVWDAYSIFDKEMHEEELYAEHIDQVIAPLEDRRVIGLVAATDSAISGTDFGEEPLVANLPLPGDTGQQTYSTEAANAARRHTPPVEIPSTGNIGAGGSSGLG